MNSWNLSRKCCLLLDNDHWCMTGKQMRCVSCQSLVSHIKCWMTDWFQLERCYVTPMHCSHKIIKVLIITRLPQNITCLCNITRNAKFGKFILGIVLKYTAQKVYISVYFLKWNNINWILNMIGYTRWWLESTIQTIALFRITFWLFRERNVWSLS